jgi:tetratricopeptide (TPR) repeat protein
MLTLLGTAMAVTTAVTSANAQLAVPRSNEKVLFLIPSPGDGTDTAYVAELADEVRKRMRNKMRHKLRVLQNDVICQVLEESAYRCDQVLGRADEERLARALQSDAYISGSVWHQGPVPMANFHIVDLGRSGMSGWTTVRGTPGDPPRTFAETVVDSLENQVRAAQFARECSDRTANGDFGRAMERASRAFQIYPNHPAAAMCAEIVTEALRQPVDSQIAYLQLAVQGDSLMVKAWERLGRLHQQSGDSVAALTAFARQSRVDGANRELRMGVVAGAITLREHELARDLADAWFAENPTDLGMLQLKARACIEGGLWACALESLASQYEIDTTLVGDSVFYQQIVGASQALSDTAAMLEWSGEAVRHAPDAVSLWRAHASALAAAGMLDSVVTVYDHLIELDPTDYRSALAAANILLEDLPIDTATPLDTARLFKGGEFLERATTASREPSVLMNAAVMYYQKGSALVQTRQQIPVAVAWLEKAVENDVLERLSQQSNFFLGLGLMFRIYEFDPQVTETQSCELVEEEASMISRGKRALELGASLAPQQAQQFLQQFQAFEGRIPQLRQAYSCR